MGLDLGLENSEIKTLLACENDQASRATIARNRPDIPVLGDIWKYTSAEIRSLAGLDHTDDIDVIAGGPPCQAFSTAGARRGFDDDRGNVFLRFLEIVEELMPRYVVIENVRGLLSMPVSSTPYIRRLAGELGVEAGGRHGAVRLVSRFLERAGYAVSFNLYNSANFGTPQIRERVVIIAARSGGRVPYLAPTHSSDARWSLPSWRNLVDALDGLESAQATHVAFPETRLKYFRMLEPGQHWRHLPAEHQEAAMGKSYLLSGGRTGFYRRLAWDKPSPTLVTHPAMPATALCHPTEDRPLSIEEYKRIQQFPDEWMIQGRLVDQYRQVGNAVPRGLAESIGLAITRHARREEAEDFSGFSYSRYKRTSDLDLM